MVSHSDSNGNFEKTMCRDDPCGLAVRDEGNDGKSDAGETVSSPVKVECGTDQSKQENSAAQSTSRFGLE